MKHLDPDTLALLALGELLDDPDVVAHLASCPACAATLAELQSAVRIGRSTIDLEPLESPSGAVWPRIAAELGFAEPAATKADVAPRRLRGRRWFVAIAAGVLVVAAAAGLITRALVTAAEPQVVAAASLSAFPRWTGSSGSAVVEVHAHGARTVTVRVHVAGPSGGFHEVWLMTGDLKALVALGVLHGETGVFQVPATIDLKRYTIVDVSDEPNDGNPGHSGDSIVRGQLRRS